MVLFQPAHEPAFDETAAVKAPHAGVRVAVERRALFRRVPFGVHGGFFFNQFGGDKVAQPAEQVYGRHFVGDTAGETHEIFGVKDFHSASSGFTPRKYNTVPAHGEDGFSRRNPLMSPKAPKK